MSLSPGSRHNGEVATTATAIPASRLHGHHDRPSMVSVGTIIWLSSELMFFAGLFAMYFTARAQADEWPPPPTELNLALAVPVTLVLIASSFTCQMGVFAAERGISMLQVAIGWLCAQPVVSTVIAGATKPEQVRSNAAAASWHPTPEDLEILDRICPPGRR